jgi:small multidrug resistance family-3 protein
MNFSFIMILRALILFILAGLTEIGGGYLVWQWLREGKAIWIGIVGGAILFLYGVIPTFQTEPTFGRVYAAYGGIFITLASLWGMVFDGWRPDRFDFIGAAIALIGSSSLCGDVCCFDKAEVA